MPSFLKKRLSNLNSKTNRRISNAVGAVMQPLETRTLLSGGTVTVISAPPVYIQGASGGDGFEAVGAGEMSSNPNSTLPPTSLIIAGAETGGSSQVTVNNLGVVSSQGASGGDGFEAVGAGEMSSNSQSPADGTGGGTLTGHALPPVYIQGSSGAGGTVTDNILPPGYIPGPVGGSPAGVTPINGFETTSNSQSPADGADGAGQVTDNILPPGYIQGPPNGISEEFTPVPTIGTASNLQSPADVTPASSTLPGSGESIADSLSSQAGSTDTGYYDDGPSVYDSISGTIGLL